jgi:TatA/E family protein of Tat protein translocase
LLLFGGQKLPQLASGMGKAIREFRRASTSNNKEVGDPVTLPEIIAPRS